MELGNLMFGNSRGNFPVPRGVGYEEQLIRLLDAYAPDRDNSWREYGVEFENDTFSVFPYYWGNCVCGYEEREAAWDEANHHRPECYQTILHDRLAAYKAEIGYQDYTEWLDAFDTTQEETDAGVYFVSMTPRDDGDWRAKNKLVRQKEDQIRQELCTQFGLSYPQGCAIHCTCDYKEQWAAFCAKDYHDPDCPIVKPNFLHKLSGFSISWYKYPLRDSFMSEDLSVGEFAEVIDDCIASLKDT